MLLQSSRKRMVRLRMVKEESVQYIKVVVTLHPNIRTLFRMGCPSSPISSVGSSESGSRMSIDFLLNEEYPNELSSKQEPLGEYFKKQYLQERYCRDLSREEYLKQEHLKGESPSEKAPNGKSPHARTSKSPPREKYTEEKMFFVWYHRVDLDMSWDEVTNAYNRFFPEDRRKGGLQCRFYRALDQYNVKKVRQQARFGRIRGGLIEKFGVLDCTDRRFTWMLPEHLVDPGRPVIRTHHSRSSCRE
ncbi:hypothetical protein LTS17_010414 [Exophiala oligosperma]